MQNGTGIAFLDQAQGIASRNECSRNDTVGISVGNEAQPALEGNTCNQNLYGIVYAGSRGGVARQNSVTQNSVGVLIGEDASPEMEGNNIYGNEEKNIRDLRP
jgi:parallel beta-helix repeat protein